MAAEGLHPLGQYRRASGRIPSPWAEHGWYVYLETPLQVERRVLYVERNPAEAGLPPQKWPFVVPYVMRRSGDRG
jgi:hypothetical protein